MKNNPRCQAQCSVILHVLYWYWFFDLSQQCFQIGAVMVLCHFIDKHREVDLSQGRKNRGSTRARIINESSSVALEFTLLTTFMLPDYFCAPTSQQLLYSTETDWGVCISCHLSAALDTNDQALLDGFHLFGLDNTASCSSVSLPLAFLSWMFMPSVLIFLCFPTALPIIYTHPVICSVNSYTWLTKF